jgi:hypothetical protein
VIKNGKGEYDMLSNSNDILELTQKKIEKQSRLTFMNNKFMNKATEMEFELSYDLEKSFDGKNSEITLILEDVLSDNDIKLSRKLETFDLAVLNCSYSFYKANSAIIDVPAIKKSLTQLGNSRRKIDLDDQINLSLRKLAATRILIRYPEDTKDRNNNTIIEIESYLLPVDRVRVKPFGAKFNDELRDVFTFLKEPALITYADAMGKKQYFTLDAKWFNTPVNKTKDAVTLNYRLAQRINHIKHEAESKRNKKGNQIILFDNLFNDCNLLDGLAASTIKSKKMKLRKLVYQMLDFYIKEKMINGYSERKSGKVIDAVIIS